MSNVNRILKVVQKLGLATYTDLEAETGIPRNKLRWACNDLKATKRLEQAEEPTTMEIAFRLAPAGLKHLDELSVSTQAGSGENNPGSSVSVHPVGKVAPPTEGAAPVIEAAKRAKKPAEPASDKAADIATTTTDIDHKLIVELISKIVLFPEGEQFANLPGFVADLFARAIAANKGKTIHISACPFCGHNDVEISEIGPGEFSITCPECSSIGPSQGTAMDAISYWNDRRGT